MLVGKTEVTVKLFISFSSPNIICVSVARILSSFFLSSPDHPFCLILPAQLCPLSYPSQLHTNIGTFPVSVRGAAAYPKFIVRSSVIDFGVCGIGYRYNREFEIVNRGKVSAVLRYGVGLYCSAETI